MAGPVARIIADRLIGRRHAELGRLTLRADIRSRHGPWPVRIAGWSRSVEVHAVVPAWEGSHACCLRPSVAVGPVEIPGARYLQPEGIAVGVRQVAAIGVPGRSIAAGP